ncbi:MAG: hypothetical protein MZV70_37085 [Desulfobacterales bacterium]|nr:hypothetical protein [Desulfobacterales bacterium]
MVVITAFGSISGAVEAMKYGAYDFLEKPFNMDTLEISLTKILRQHEILKENIELKGQIQQHTEGLDQLVGSHPKMQRLYEQILTAAETDLTVLILGETGHRQGAHRPLHPFPERQEVQALCGDQLRRHPGEPPGVGILRPRERGLQRRHQPEDRQVRKGPYRNALPRRDRRHPAGPPGQDPAGDRRPQDHQARQQPGDGAGLPGDLRHEPAHPGHDQEGALPGRPLLPHQRLPHHRAASAGAEGRHLAAGRPFHRQDMPGSSIPVSRGSPPKAMDQLAAYPWPGNVREMENIIQHAMVSTRSELITGFPELRQGRVGTRASTAHHPCPRSPPYWVDAGEGNDYHAIKQTLLEQFERKYLAHLLDKHGGVIAEAARESGLNYKTFYLKVEKYRLTKKRERSL